MPKEKLEEFNATPMGRSGQPSEIATCCVFLASKDSSFISGMSRTFPLFYSIFPFILMILLFLHTFPPNVKHRQRRSTNC